MCELASAREMRDRELVPLFLRRVGARRDRRPARRVLWKRSMKRIVLTGGPGAGKTAVLELVRRSLCSHVRVLPESAGILFGGGFPRSPEPATRSAAQRAIFYVQRELESTAATADTAIALCDRGTVDSLAYWPGPGDFWSELGTSLDEQLARYHLVIHLRVPPVDEYTHRNPLRIETPAQAAAIDERIAAAWARHPRRVEVPASSDFLVKAHRAIEIIRGELPSGCLGHHVAA